MNKFVCKYYDRRLLSTIDINSVVSALLDHTFGSIELLVVPMTDEERSQVCTEVGEIRMVDERFWVFEVSEEGDALRRREIERQAIDRGQK